MLHLSDNATVQFIYILDEDIEKAGWSASLDIEFDKNSDVTKINSLRHIAMTTKPTVPEAQLKLGAEEEPMPSNADETDIKKLAVVVESMRLQLSEISKLTTNEKEEPPKTPETKPLHERLDLSLGDEPTIQDIVRAGIEIGLF